MADDKNAPEENARPKINPNDREGLKRAADELLKQDRKAGRKSAWSAETPDESAYEYDDVEGDDAETIANEITELQAENNDMKDRLLRLAADMENLRRRTEREVKDARAFAISGFARDMLAVADNLRRAIEAVTAEQRETADDTLKNLIEGVELTEKSMHSAMERHGVKKLEPENQKFDPNFHQAMFEVPNPEVPNNTVVQVVQAGYRIGDRVLRPAMVGVAKGGPKQNAETEPGAPNPQAEKDA
ncbi:nucleotide exchange factor GrpE [Oricola cellulosilytica]|uniref:Protein GrpE n=1 Tax=Oricola cellulosilytica TaxID=1429082 RepID=A0A4R0PHL6_9HYPH|nr:nucleotide exchange factor GrpE [Oricola cellulosilytica]TCD16060.1 nucleotide exchange factor GrpE [Oricola cellulosilytica]